ncbi:unnamed protein product, partial [Choristocarpus tenellus]
VGSGVRGFKGGISVSHESGAVVEKNLGVGRGHRRSITGNGVELVSDVGAHTWGPVGAPVGAPAGICLVFEELEAVGLSAMDSRATGGKSDPYVSFSSDPKNLVVPTHQGKMPQTEVKVNTLNPKWDSQYTCCLTVSDPEVLRHCHVSLLVWDRDLGTKDDLIGVANLSLSDVMRASPPFSTAPSSAHAVESVFEGDGIKAATPTTATGVCELGKASVVEAVVLAGSHSNGGDVDVVNDGRRGSSMLTNSKYFVSDRSGTEGESHKRDLLVGQGRVQGQGQRQGQGQDGDKGENGRKSGGYAEEDSTLGGDDGVGGNEHQGQTRTETAADEQQHTQHECHGDGDGNRQHDNVVVKEETSDGDAGLKKATGKGDEPSCLHHLKPSLSNDWDIYLPFEKARCRYEEGLSFNLALVRDGLPQGHIKGRCMCIRSSGLWKVTSMPNLFGGSGHGGWGGAMPGISWGAWSGGVGSGGFGNGVVGISQRRKKRKVRSLV